MTKGYFVIEEKGKITKAVYLVADAYLDNGYGEKIIRAFAEKQELKFLEKIYQNLDLMDKRNIQSIKPEWYRKTIHSGKEDIFSEYAYVIQGEKLKAYYYGKLLFCLKREEAEIWLYLLKNMQLLIDHFLYSSELMEYQWKNYFSMFRFLQKKIEEGVGKQEFQQYMRREELPLAFFRDEHLVDVWDRYDIPAYQKIWKKGTQEIQFIVARQERIWRTYIQGPYSRIAVFQKCSSEKKMCDVIRLELRKESQKFEQYAKITAYVSEAAKELFGQKIKLEEIQGYLQEEQQKAPWYLCESALSVTNIIDHLKMNLRNEQYRHNRKKQ